MNLSAPARRTVRKKQGEAAASPWLAALRLWLEHVSRKWIPVSGQKTCFNKELEQWRDQNDRDRL